MVRQLAAVSDDICAAFQNTVDGFKTEMARQRRLLDVLWRPDIQLCRTDLEVLCKDEPEPGPDQESSSADQEKPEDPGPSDGEKRPAEPQGPGDTGGRGSCAECHVCGKTFKLNFHLKRHMRSHQKPYLGHQ